MQYNRRMHKNQLVAPYRTMEDIDHTTEIIKECFEDIYEGIVFVENTASELEDYILGSSNDKNNEEPEVFR